MADKSTLWKFVDATERDATVAANGVKVGDLASLESGAGMWRWNGSAWAAEGSSGGGRYGLLAVDTIATAPVGLWNFDGDALDISGNGNDGSKVDDSEYIAIGGRQWLHIPNVGIGTPGHIDVPADAAFQLDASMSCFCVGASLNGFSASGFLMNCGDPSGASDPDRQLHSLFMSSSSTGYPGTQWKRSATSYSANSTLSPTTVERGCSLFTVGYTRDATTNVVTCFYNGAMVETFSARLPPTPGQGANNGMTFGANFGGASPLNGGIVGSAGLWDAVLTAADMRALHTAIDG